MFRRLATITPRAVRSQSSLSQHTPIKVTGSVDGGFEKDRIHKAPGEPNQREFTYFILGGARFIYASAVRLALVKFVASMQPSADVLALASAEFNLDGIAEGTTLTVKWRGKPVFIRHRTDDEISKEVAVPLNLLKDPQTDAVRVQDPKWYVI
jgi:ubiquinol-cytochrome c reductase iron-sulfur subunit